MRYGQAIGPQGPELVFRSLLGESRFGCDFRGAHRWHFWRAQAIMMPGPFDLDSPGSTLEVERVRVVYDPFRRSPYSARRSRRVNGAPPESVFSVAAAEGGGHAKNGRNRRSSGPRTRAKARPNTACGGNARERA